ncbi:MAG: alpha/beta hydrolase [Anaerolineaceae bacterium]|nr:alpha/beta hydrolase [Anaerolineaceae bacterium]
MAKYKTHLFILLAGLMAMGVVAVTSRYFGEMKAARQALDALGSQVIETECGPIEYARAGEGYPLLAVHGALGGFDAGLMVAQPAIAAGYQVISISRFGYLRSPLPENAGVDGQAEAFACLLDELEIRQAAVLAVSGGATSAIRFTARYPQRVSALILLSPAAPGDVQVAPPPEAALTLMRSDFVYWAMLTYLKPVMQRMIGVPQGFVLTPQTDAEVKEILAATLPSSQRMDGFYLDNFGVTPDFYAEISESSPYSVYTIKTPVLVIHALDDPLAAPENVRGLAEKFPRARLYEVPDGGHLLLGHSEEMWSQMMHFLRSHAAVASGSRQLGESEDRDDR